jgi:hypothetical protein
MRFLVSILLNICVLITIALGVLKLTGLHETSWFAVFAPLIFVFAIKFLFRKLKK